MNPTDALLERIEACVTTINAAPGKVWECDGESIVADVRIIEGKVCSHPICEIDCENQDDFDPESCEFPESSELIAAAIIEGHKTAPDLLTESAAEIRRLQKVVDQAIEMGDFELGEYDSVKGITRPDIDAWVRAGDYPELYEEIERRGE